jgi:hypothetical protein
MQRWKAVYNVRNPRLFALSISHSFLFFCSYGYNTKLYVQVYVDFFVLKRNLN